MDVSIPSITVNAVAFEVVAAPLKYRDAKPGAIACARYPPENVPGAPAVDGGSDAIR